MIVVIVIGMELAKASNEMIELLVDFLKPGMHLIQKFLQGFVFFHAGNNFVSLKRIRRKEIGIF